MEIWKPFFKIFFNIFFFETGLAQQSWLAWNLSASSVLGSRVCHHTSSTEKKFFMTTSLSKHPRSKTKSDKVGSLESSTMLTNAYLGLAKRRKFLSIPVGREEGREDAISLYKRTTPRTLF